MSDSQAQVSIRILEKEYQVACPASEEADLAAAAELLNRSMRDIRDRGKVVGLDRVAVMAALNLANEVLKFRSRDGELSDIVGARIESLRDKLDTALGHGKQLSL
ncbi:MAG TPA: cell division protein ZapA [Gammaproteobacteria bacterium]|nr:cell division protein ZapA [Gammaproteobacteria bacterium]